MTDDRPLNLAMLGTGRIAATRLAPALDAIEGARLWSVLSRDPGRAADFARVHGALAPEPAHTDLDALLADPDLDGVIVATPDALHADQGVAAARAGKHVLVEKPMATSSGDARRMVEEADRAGVRLAVAYHLRWHAGHRLLNAMVQSGDLGELRHMHVQWAWAAPDASNWRAHSEVGRWWSLAGVGTHCLDLVRWLMVPLCGEVEAVESLVSRPVWNGPHDEQAVVSLKFGSGATAVFTSSVLFSAPHRMEVYGSSGYALGRNTLGPQGGGTIDTHQGAIAFTPKNPYVGEIANFVRAIRTGTPPEVDGVEGLRNVELLERACP